jgi:hypothetical protein
VHINAHRAGFVLGVLIAVQYGEVGGRAQGLPSVRVIPADAKIFVRPEIMSDVVTVTHAGSVLELIDKREGWYWILLGRDENGSRQPGWIQANQVVIGTAPTSRDSLRTLHEELGALPAPTRPGRIDARKAERKIAREEAREARAAARVEASARIASKKAERETARKAAGDARAAARVEEAARKVEEARRKYEGLTKKAE